MPPTLPGLLGQLSGRRKPAARAKGRHASPTRRPVSVSAVLLGSALLLSGAAVALDDGPPAPDRAAERAPRRLTSVDLVQPGRDVPDDSEPAADPATPSSGVPTGAQAGVRPQDVPAAPAPRERTASPTPAPDHRGRAARWEDPAASPGRAAGFFAVLGLGLAALALWLRSQRGRVG